MIFKSITSFIFQSWDSSVNKSLSHYHFLLEGPGCLYSVWIQFDLICGRHCFLAAQTIPISEKIMAPHSSTLAWEIPWTEEPGRLQSMESLRVRHGWVTSLSLFTFLHWRRKWQPTPVFLPGESQGLGSLVGCGLWGLIELDTTEAT